MLKPNARINFWICFLSEASAQVTRVDDEAVRLPLMKLKHGNGFGWLRSRSKLSALSLHIDYYITFAQQVFVQRCEAHCRYRALHARIQLEILFILKSKSNLERMRKNYGQYYE